MEPASEWPEHLVLSSDDPAPKRKPQWSEWPEHSDQSIAAAAGSTPQWSRPANGRNT